MNDAQTLADFVKSRLEESEGITPEALARVLAAADAARVKTPRSATRLGHLGPVLLAATLVAAASGWLFHAEETATRREANLTNVIALLNAVDGYDFDADLSLPDNLLAWQDAPLRDAPAED